VNLKKAYRIGATCGTKSFKLAVKDVSFGIKYGDCFGLLGTNGAGKTTTFKMLSGEIPPTKGLAKIGGFDISSNMTNIR
jgi:ATP-binding cassette, subfamily A (ABC1), member 3